MPKKRRRCLVTFSDEEFDQVIPLAKAKGLKIATYIHSLVITEYNKKGTRRAPTR